MKLWRLDAVHEQDVSGSFCLLFREQMEAQIAEGPLAAVGWMTDVYLEDLGPIAPWLASRIVGVPWPLTPGLGWFVTQQLQVMAAAEKEAKQGAHA